MGTASSPLQEPPSSISSVDFNEGSCWNSLRREWMCVVNTATEVLWQQVLPSLRGLLPRKIPVSGSPVHVIGHATVPESVKQVLSCGPKFAVEPKKKPP
ncbi:hypothetical protein MTO96_032644 [Rhipicephalus appendiculatus]